MKIGTGLGFELENGVGKLVHRGIVIIEDVECDACVWASIVQNTVLQTTIGTDCAIGGSENNSTDTLRDLDSKVKSATNLYTTTGVFNSKTVIKIRVKLES